MLLKVALFVMVQRFFLIFSSGFQETTSNHEKDCKCEITNSKAWE